MSTMKELDIYYTITIKKKEIEKELYQTLSKQFDIKRFENVKEIKKFDQNVIKSGIESFKNIWTTQKLKSSRDVLFIFIGKGDIPKVYSNIKMMMISQNPTYGENKFSYAISKSASKNIIKEFFPQITKTKPLTYYLSID